MSAPVPAPRPSAHAFGVALGALIPGKPSCRCWMCTGPARMKLVAVVERPRLAEPIRAVHAAFWRKFSPEAVPSGR